MDPKDVEQLLESRRSIRKYREEMPSEKLLEEMIQCALHAPSPSNSQPVRFVRFKSSDSRQRLHQTMGAAKERYLAHIAKYPGFKSLRNKINFFYRHSVFMFDAPVLMAAGTIAGLPGLTRHLSPAEVSHDRRKKDRDLDISLGLAVKGFILKAHSLGLGTCILTAPLHFVPDLDHVLPQDELRLKCFITVGFPDQTPDLPPRRTVGDIYREI